MAKKSPVFFETNNERSFAQDFVQFGVVGPTIVLLHGLGSSADELKALAKELSQFAHTIVVDLPGFGLREDEEVSNLDEFVTAVCETLDEAGVQSAIWLGCSFGGHVALRATQTAPERVKSLILLASGGLFESIPEGLKAHYSEDALKSRSMDTVRAACEMLVKRHNQATREFTERRLKAHKIGAYQGIINAALAAIADQTGKNLESIGIPVHLIHGQCDPLVNIEIARKAFNRFSNAYLTELEEVGHMPWLEVPTTVAKAVQPFIAEAQNFSNFSAQVTETFLKKTAGTFFHRVSA